MRFAVVLPLSLGMTGLLAGAGALADRAVSQDQQPVFRADVELIRIDVSVFDRAGRPVRGLTAANFQVFEDGKPQRVVAVQPVEHEVHDPQVGAWMRQVPHDVAANDLADRAGNGRLFAIVLDDRNLPADDRGMVLAAREIGRGLVDRLGASDIAAVVFPWNGALTQDFTEDRWKLRQAVDALESVDRLRSMQVATGSIFGAGPPSPLPPSFGPVMPPSKCERSEPLVAVLDIVASRLASVPERRKTIFLVSVGVPLNAMMGRVAGASRECAHAAADLLEKLLDKARRANINVIPIDPAGPNGYYEYLRRPVFRPGRPPVPARSTSDARTQASSRRSFLETIAEQTGGRMVVDTDSLGGDLDAELDKVFDESGAYYLVGYETSNRRRDGKFRRLEIRTDQRDVIVRARSGYYATPDESARSAALSLRASAVAIAPASSDGSKANVAIVTDVRLPTMSTSTPETLTFVRTIYDSEGRAGELVREFVRPAIVPSSTDLRYELRQAVALAPGRYQIRYHVTSAVLGRNGTVYADVEVPDFSRAGLSVSQIILGSLPPAPDDALTAIVPFSLTTRRSFTSTDDITALVHVFHGGSDRPSQVTASARILDRTDSEHFTTERVLTPDAVTGAMPFDVPLPLGRLAAGPYLLTISIASPGRPPIRRDLRFNMR
jgi:VWFA-related protein